MTIEQRYSQKRRHYYWSPRCSMWFWFLYYFPSAFSLEKWN